MFTVHEHIFLHGNLLKIHAILFVTYFQILVTFCFMIRHD